MSETNQILANSRLLNKRVELVLHDDTVTLDESPTNINQTFDNLEMSATIQALREQYDADAVLFYLADTPNQGQGGVATMQADYASAFGLVNLESDLSEDKTLRTTAHELGHIFGADHELSHELEHPISGQLYGRYTNVTPVLTDNQTGILHYSNPKVNYRIPPLALPTGTEVKDNSLIISNHMCEVADFELEGPYSAQIYSLDALPQDQCYTDINLKVAVKSGNTGGANQGPYTYNWSYRTHPGSPPVHFSSIPEPTFYRPIPAHNTYIVEVAVQDINTDAIATDVFLVRFIPCSISYRSTHSQTDLIALDEADLNEEYIGVEAKGRSEGIFKLIDLTGRQLATSKSILAIRRTLSSLNPGNYLLLRQCGASSPCKEEKYLVTHK